MLYLSRRRAAFFVLERSCTFQKTNMIPYLILIAGAALTASPVALADSSTLTLSQNPETMTAYVREYYKDDPILAEIAWCESRMRQFGKNGEVIKNPNSSAIGVMQIMSSLHVETAAELGFDITTTNGNLDYAQYLYDKEGTRPWNASKACWGKRLNLAVK